MSGATHAEPVLNPGPLHAEAVAALASLLARLGLDAALVGEAATACWLGRPFDRGTLDALAIVSPDQRGEIPRTAGDDGFRVDPDEVEAARELDLVPLHWESEHGHVRVHVLLATNALYARMIPAAREVRCREWFVDVIAPEDQALLLSLSDDSAALAQRDEIVSRFGERFDRAIFNRRLISIGLSGMVL